MSTNPNTPTPQDGRKGGWFARNKALAGVGAVVVLAGVGGAIGATQDDPADTPAPAAATAPETTTKAPTTTQAPAATEQPRVAHPGKPVGAIDDIYVDYLHDNGIYSSRGTLIQLGHTICHAFDVGMTFEEVGITALTSDTAWGPEQIGTIIGSSVAAFCPWHEDIVRGGQPA